MKNGHIPEHWQLKLWIGLAALALAAVARQSAIDTGGMSSFNANLIFIGIIVAFVLLYLGFSDFFIKTFESAFQSLFKWLGFQERQTIELAEAEPSTESLPISEDTTVKPTEQIQQTYIEVPTTEQAVDTAQSGIVKIEAPTPKKIVIDYEGRREQAKKRQEDRAYEKEANVILYVGYIMSPFVEKNVVEKIIDAVTEFIHTSGVPEFPKEAAIRLPDELSTTDMMHFGWNIAKPFKKYNLHTAHFLKQVFADTFRDVEVCTIERKLKYNGTQGKIKINENVECFVIPDEDEPVETTTKSVTEKTASKKQSSKPKKSAKDTNKPKRDMSAMELAMADMAETLTPYNPGDNILEDPDEYSYNDGW